MTIPREQIPPFKSYEFKIPQGSINSKPTVEDL